MWLIVTALALGITFALCSAWSPWILIPICCLFLFFNWPWAYFCALVFIWLIPVFWSRWQENQRQQQFNQNFPSFLDSLVTHLKSGLTLEASLRSCLDYVTEPVKTFLQEILHQTQLGIPIEKALITQEPLWLSPLLKRFNEAILLARQSGLDMSRILTTLSQEAREDAVVAERLMSMSAQGRLQAWILGLMPFVMLGLLNFLEPEMIQNFFNDPRGKVLFVLMICLEALGIFWIRRLIRF